MKTKRKQSWPNPITEAFDTVSWLACFLSANYAENGFRYQFKLELVPVEDKGAATYEDRTQ